MTFVNAGTKCIFYIPALVLVASLTGCQGKMLYQQKEFAVQPSQIHTISVLEPRLEVVEKTLIGNDTYLEASDNHYIHIRDVLSESLKTLMVLNGYSAKRLDQVSMKSLGLVNLSASHAEISARVFDRRNGGSIDLLGLRVLDPARAAAEMGDSHVDAYLYTNYIRRCKSSGRMAAEQMLLFVVAAAAGASSAPSANGGCISIIEAVLMRANTMEVLWANRVSPQTLVPELVAEGVLDKFPRITTAKK